MGISFLLPDEETQVGVNPCWEEAEREAKTRSWAPRSSLLPTPHACGPRHCGQVWLFLTPWKVAHQAPLSMGFSRQEYWSGLPCPSPGYLPDVGIKPTSLMSPVLTGQFFTTNTTWKPTPHLLPKLPELCQWQKGLIIYVASLYTR